MPDDALDNPSSPPAEQPGAGPQADTASSAESAAGAARLLGLAGEQRAGHHVGFDVDHDDVLACGDRRKTVADAHFRITGGLDHDLDRRMTQEGSGVLEHAGGAGLRRLVERAGGKALLLPAAIAQIGLGAIGSEIGQPDHLHAGRAPRLGEEHGAELARADHADADRPTGRRPFEQQTVEVHARSSPWSRPATAL